jgi:hypothetical protein
LSFNKNIKSKWDSLAARKGLMNRWIKVVKKLERIRNTVKKRLTNSFLSVGELILLRQLGSRIVQNSLSNILAKVSVWMTLK